MTCPNVNHKSNFNNGNPLTQHHPSIATTQCLLHSPITSKRQGQGVMRRMMTTGKKIERWKRNGKLEKGKKSQKKIGRGDEN